MKKTPECHKCGGEHYTAFCRNYPVIPDSSKVKQKPSSLTSKPKKLSKKPKVSPRTKAKNQAWDAFSIYIRTRDCLRFGHSTTEGQCITCKNWYDFKHLQAGHFINGRGNMVLFDERLVYSQCGYCNCKPPYGLNGNLINYTLFMLSEGWTQDGIAELQRLKGQTKVYKLHDFIEIKELYKQKTIALLTQA